jgi:hypothetical protein
MGELGDESMLKDERLLIGQLKVWRYSQVRQTPSTLRNSIGSGGGSIRTPCIDWVQRCTKIAGHTSHH